MNDDITPHISTSPLCRPDPRQPNVDGHVECTLTWIGEPMTWAAVGLHPTPGKAMPEAEMWLCAVDQDSNGGAYTASSSPPPPQAATHNNTKHQHQPQHDSPYNVSQTI